MTFRARVKPLLDVDGIDASIDIQMMKNPHIIIDHLADLEYGRNPYISTLKKDSGDIFQNAAPKYLK